MEKYAFEIVGSRRLENKEEPIPLTAELQKKVQDALKAQGWGIFWSTNFDRAAVGHCLFPIRTAPPDLMQEIEQLSPLYLLGMPWGTALYLDESANTVNLIISSPAAIEEVFFSDLQGDEREKLHGRLNDAADVLRKVGAEVVGEPTGERLKGYRFPNKKIASKETYAEVVFERPLNAGESPKDAVEDVAKKMSDGLENTFYWHVSGIAPVSDTAKIIMTCHVAYAHLAMEMGTYHCPALPCTTVAFAENGRVKAAMLKPIHMFKTFFRDVPWWTAAKYWRFPLQVRKEIRNCLCKYLACK